MLPMAPRAAVLVMVSTASSLTGCAALERTRPFDMSAAEHENAAVESSERARREAIEAEKGGVGARYHRANAKRSAALACAHARAAEVLVAAEKRACEGVAPADIAPGLAGVEVLRTFLLERRFKRQDIVEGAGAVVATNGSSFDAFARVMRCRLARAAVTRDPSDPLAVRGASLLVYRDDGDAAVVQFRVKEDDDRGREIVRRVARQLGSEEVPGKHGSDPDDSLGISPVREGDQDPRTHGPASPGPEVPGPFAPPIGGPAPKR